MKPATQGYLSSIAASLFFAALTVTIKSAAPLSSLFVTAWRIVGALPLLTMLLWYSNPKEARALLRLPLRSWLFHVLPSALVIGIQFGLFAWAPLHGQGVALALGYLLVPMMLVLIGLVAYRERFSPMQWIGLGLVSYGVLHETLTMGIRAITMAIFLGMPLYFHLHRKSSLSTLQLVTAEMALLFPIALLEILSSSENWSLVEVHSLKLLPLIGVGLITGLAYGTYLKANQLLPYSVFGVLSYLEPILLLCVALGFGESIAPKAISFTYAPILWGALVVSWPKRPTATEKNGEKAPNPVAPSKAVLEI